MTSRAMFWMTAVLAMAMAAPVAAQSDSPIEASAGYASLRDYDHPMTFPRGWFASVARNVAPPFAIVGDTSGSYRSIGRLDTHVAVRIHAFMAGPRVVWRIGRLTPYAQMMFGVARTTSIFRLPKDTVSKSHHNFAMAPGGGLDLPLSNRAAVRVGASLRLIQSQTYTANGPEPFKFRELQFIAGIVVR